MLQCLSSYATLRLEMRVLNTLSEFLTPSRMLKTLHSLDRANQIPVEIPTLETRGELAMSYADKTLTCRDCGEEFFFTAGEQEFYAQKGFTNEPTRCLNCRQQHKARMNNRDGMGGYRSSNNGPREQHTTVCAGCGREATVPFVPRNNKPVYCDDCFQSQWRGA